MWSKHTQGQGPILGGRGPSSGFTGPYQMPKTQGGRVPPSNTQGPVDAPMGSPRGLKFPPRGRTSKPFSRGMRDEMAKKARREFLDDRDRQENPDPWEFIEDVQETLEEWLAPWFEWGRYGPATPLPQWSNFQMVLDCGPLNDPCGFALGYFAANVTEPVGGVHCNCVAALPQVTSFPAAAATTGVGQYVIMNNKAAAAQNGPRAWYKRIATGTPQPVVGRVLPLPVWLLPPEPWFDPEEWPSVMPEPDLKPALYVKPYTKPAVSIMVRENPRGNPVTGGKPRVPQEPHVNLPPPAGVPARQKKVWRGTGKLGKLYGALTEIGDALDCFEEVMQEKGPTKEGRKGGKLHERLFEAAGRLPHMTAEQFAQFNDCMTTQGMTDRMVGKANRAVNDALRHAGKRGMWSRPVGYGFGPHDTGPARF